MITIYNALSTCILQLGRIPRLTVSPSTPPVTPVPIVPLDGNIALVRQDEGNIALTNTLAKINNAFNDINGKIAQLNDKANAICDQC